MRARILLLGPCLGWAPAACIDRAPFACESDEQCQRSAQDGHCAAPGYCAVPDDSCASGWSFGRFATPQLEGRCTEPEVGSSSGNTSLGTDSSDGSGNTDSSSSSSGDPIPLEECDGIDNDGDGLVDEWSPVNEQCNDCDLFQERGRAYWLCSNGRWTDLQPLCTSLGANLASIQDAEENLFLALRTPAGANWIGINDIGNDGVYTWVDGEPVDYTNWIDVDPPGPNPDSNCGGINTQGEWQIFNCTNSRPGFCEAPHPD